MKPELARFESENSEQLKLVRIDLSRRDQDKMRTYGHAWKEGGIPYTVLLDDQGKVIKARRGFLTAAQLSAEFGSSLPR
ncbi:MAG: hypothetical protein HY319_22960 [Armatimonadetes bacterium]|nr:hypothetical protein [Armatimonadota bacterium]